MSAFEDSSLPSLDDLIGLELEDTSLTSPWDGDEDMTEGSVSFPNPLMINPPLAPHGVEMVEMSDQVFNFQYGDSQFLDYIRARTFNPKISNHFSGFGTGCLLPNGGGSATDQALRPIQPRPDRYSPTHEDMACDSQPIRSSNQSSNDFESKLMFCPSCGRKFVGKSARQNLWRHRRWNYKKGANKTVMCDCKRVFKRSDALGKHRTNGQAAKDAGHK